MSEAAGFALGVALWLGMIAGWLLVGWLATSLWRRLCDALDCKEPTGCGTVRTRPSRRR